MPVVKPVRMWLTLPLVREFRAGKLISLPFISIKKRLRGDYFRDFTVALSLKWWELRKFRQFLTFLTKVIFHCFFNYLFFVKKPLFFFKKCFIFDLRFSIFLPWAILLHSLTFNGLYLPKITNIRKLAQNGALSTKHLNFMVFADIKFRLK